jgi:hypothetical protein
LLSTVLIALIVALKFLLPVLLIPFPFFAGWANFVLDTIDGDLLIPLGLSDPVYQNIDKSADWVTYVFMVLAAWRGRWPILKIVIALFIFRSIGQALFFITGDELMFFFFPNFLEPLFLAYATILFFRKADAPRFYRTHWLWIWAIVIVYKMQDEYITHVANFDRSDAIQRLLSGVRDLFS